ncbi:MAG TPA: hypothetical protein VJ694_00105 [Patescibacteria group bacterium]|nr:hypothetical protein [Patescibacteria group bacterium]
MGVPLNVIERIDRLEQARRNVEEHRRRDDVAQRRRQAVQADRNARRQLLMDLAVEVFGWRDAFVKSREGQRLWSLLGSGARVYLFSDWFWEGLPIAENNPVRAHTRVFLDGPGHHFLFEEWRNGDDRLLEPYQESCRAKSPLELVDHVHPLLLERLQTHLSGPEAWQTILDELDRRLARYVTATAP